MHPRSALFIQRLASLGLIGAALLKPLSALSWSQHYLMTARALEHPALTQEKALEQLSPKRLSRKVRVEALEEFLAKEQSGVAQVFKEFESWVLLKSKETNRPLRWANPFPFPENPQMGKPSREAFLKAARLNPEATFPLVIRIFPGAQPQHQEVPATSVNRAVSPMPSFPAEDWVQRFDAVEGREVTAYEVLTNYSDEPDWGFDQALWSHKEYGYGELPYGKLEGTASQAPFHMLFRHENLIMNTVAPELRDGMGVERFELFRRLAGFAFKTGHPYWGLRFTAWALHYVQDLTQPYHARAVPHGNWKWLLRYLISSDKKHYQAETLSIVKNRHLMFEDAMAFALQQTWSERHPLQDALAQRLSSGMVTYGEEVRGSSEKFLMAVASIAAKHAQRVDSCVESAFEARVVKDPTYALENDTRFKIRDIMRGIYSRQREAEELFAEAGTDFEQAGRSTRAVLQTLIPQDAF
jgi:hypothetical protein